MGHRDQTDEDFVPHDIHSLVVALAHEFTACAGQDLQVRFSAERADGFVLFDEVKRARVTSTLDGEGKMWLNITVLVPEDDPL